MFTEAMMEKTDAEFDERLCRVIAKPRPPSTPRNMFGSRLDQEVRHRTVLSHALQMVAFRTGPPLLPNQAARQIETKLRLTWWLMSLR